MDKIKKPDAIFRVRLQAQMHPQNDDENQPEDIQDKIKSLDDLLQSRIITAEQYNQAVFNLRHGLKFPDGEYQVEFFLDDFLPLTKIREVKNGIAKKEAFHFFHYKHLEWLDRTIEEMAENFSRNILFKMGAPKIISWVRYEEENPVSQLFTFE